MKTLKLFILSLLLILAFSTGVKAEFFSDVIITSPNGIWTDSRAYSTLNAAITAVGANQRTVKVVSPQTVTSLTVPANVTLEFERDGSITNSGQLTINTLNIIADNHQIFTGSGDIDFAQGSVVKSSWFSNIDTAIALTADDSITLKITKQETLHTSVAVGNAVTLKWDSYLMIGSAAGITLSNIGQVEAGKYQIFSGPGNFRFRDGTVLDLSWFISLRAAITHISTSAVTLVNTLPVTVDLSDTIPANITLVIKRGGILTVNGGITLVISGDLVAGPYQIFVPTGTVTLSYVKDIYPEWYSSGTFTKAAIDVALTAIGLTNKVTLLLRPGTWVIGSNVDWSTYTNVTFKSFPGTLLSHSTYTINIPNIDAGLYQLFNGTGAVTLSGSSKESYPEWFATNTTPGTTDMTTAIQSAIDSVSITGGTVRLSRSSYAISSTLYLSKTLSGTNFVTVNLVGSGQNVSYITHKTGSTGVMIWLGNYTQNVPTNYYQSQFAEIGNLTLIPCSGTTYAMRLRECYSPKIHDLYINYSTGGSAITGIWAEAVVEAVFDHIDINLGDTAGSSLCWKIGQSRYLDDSLDANPIQSTSSIVKNGYFHYANKGAIIYANQWNFYSCKWETLVYGVWVVTGFSNTFRDGYYENIANNAFYIYGTDMTSAGGNHLIEGGFANRYSIGTPTVQLAGDTAASTFCQISNTGRVTIRNVQIENSTSIYGTLSASNTNIDAFIDAYPNCLTNPNIRYDLTYYRLVTPTLTTTNGTNIVTVTTVADHGLVVGQVIDTYNFNGTNLNLTAINAPFLVVASVPTTKTFTFVAPSTASGNGTDATGTIYYYYGGKWTNARLPSNVRFNDCEYETIKYTITMAAPGTDQTMLSDGHEYRYFDNDFYLTKAVITVDNANANNVSTYVYVYTSDSTASRFDEYALPINLDISAIGAKTDTALTIKKFMSGQGFKIRLWDNGGSGAAYPRIFNVYLTIAKTNRSPL